MSDIPQQNELTTHAISYDSNTLNSKFCNMAEYLETTAWIKSGRGNITYITEVQYVHWLNKEQFKWYKHFTIYTTTKWILFPLLFSQHEFFQNWYSFLDGEVHVVSLCVCGHASIYVYDKRNQHILKHYKSNTCIYIFLWNKPTKST